MGKISYLQIWNRTLDQGAEFALLPAITLQDATIPDWYWEGLLVDWDWGTYETAHAVVRSVPSLRGQKVCPLGMAATPLGSPIDQQTCEGDGNYHDFD